ncbi:hypothetical protein IP87_11820 [beta proteobacterium AAP121]|nr:hypothetical protein IP80_03805 [beta proteobacterium AAP65]KPF97236.1 hypothetical protein IP87_11820 [beta proteobacterium AAP121]
MSRSTAYGQASSSFTVPPGLVGTVQAHGLLLVLREPQLRIVQASSSAAHWLERPLPTLLLATLLDLGGDADSRLRQLLDTLQPAEPRPWRCTLGVAPAERAYEGCVHRVSTDTVVLELEPQASSTTAGPTQDATSSARAPTQAALLAHLSRAVQRFSEAGSVAALSVAAAQAVRGLLGHDRVFITEFGPDGRGCVIAEDRAPRLPAWLGQNRLLDEAWPDPSVRSRELYLHKRVRVLVDAAATPSELIPALPPGSGGGHDLTLGELRSTSAAHAERLRAHGVAASVVAALVREDQLWGLITCHHPQPRRPAQALRAALELLAEVFMTRVVALENYARAQVRAEVRRLEQRLLQATSVEGDWRAALLRNEAALLQPLDASAALLWHGGEVLGCGAAPARPALQALEAWLQVQDDSAASWQHSALPLPGDDADGLPQASAGVLAVKLSSQQPDALVWLRRVQPDTGHCLPWTRSDLSLAQAYGAALVDMILQVNAVRLLIAEHQLSQLRSAVANSQEAAVVTDGAQRSFYPNAAFLALSGRRRDEVGSLEALAALFTQPALAHRAIGQVRAEHRPWQGELVLRRPDGRGLPVAVRAEPVQANEHPLLGCIFIFEDLSEAHEAQSLRERLEAALTRTTRDARPTEGQELVGAIIANASLAAMDIADGDAGLAAAPLLAEVEARTARATALLQQIRDVGVA